LSGLVKVAPEFAPPVYWEQTCEEGTVVSVISDCTANLKIATVGCRESDIFDAVSGCCSTLAFG